MSSKGSCFLKALVRKQPIESCSLIKKLLLLGNGCPRMFVQVLANFLLSPRQVSSLSSLRCVPAVSAVHALSIVVAAAVLLGSRKSRSNMDMPSAVALVLIT